MIRNRYAVLIASGNFQDSKLESLHCPVNDVDALNELLISSDYGKFSETYPLKNETRFNVLEKIEEVFEKAGKNDLVLIYYSGHGKQDGKGRLYLTATDTKTELLKSTSIPLDMIKILIEDSKTNKVVLILDCCLSGLAAKAFLRGSLDDRLHSLSSARGTYIMSASTGLQAAKESDTYGVFTKHIIDGIRDWTASNEDGNITMDSLYSYVHKQMLAEGSQKPMKWDLNVEGELVIASSGKSKRAERAKEIREMLLDLSSREVLPDFILIKALPIIATRREDLRKRDVEYDELLDRFSEKQLALNLFIDEWHKIASRPEQNSLVISQSDHPSVSPSETDTEQARILFEKESILVDQGKQDERLKAYDTAIEMNPKLASPWNGKGNVFLYQKKYEMAKEAFERAIELDPKFANPWNGKGIVFRNQKKYDESLGAYEKAIELDPKLAHPWNGKGNTFLDLKKYDEALAAYEKAIELDRKFAHPWNGKGNIFLDQKKYDEALNAYEKAIELEPKFANPWNGKGFVFLIQKKYEEALKAYEKAIELDPKFANPWYNKGIVLRALGLRSDADAAFAIARELGYKGLSLPPPDSPPY